MAVADGYALQKEMNRLANGGVSYRAAGTEVETQLAANQWAGTVGLGLQGALNVKAGNPVGSYRGYVYCLNQLASTLSQMYGPDGAARRIP